MSRRKLSPCDSLDLVIQKESGEKMFRIIGSELKRVRSERKVVSWASGACNR